VTAPYSGSGNLRIFPTLKSDGKYSIPNHFSKIRSKNKNVFLTEIFLFEPQKVRTLELYINHKETRSNEGH
jgi:hypothetical protein